MLLFVAFEYKLKPAEKTGGLGSPTVPLTELFTVRKFWKMIEEQYPDQMRTENNAIQVLKTDQVEVLESFFVVES